MRHAMPLLLCLAAATGAAQAEPLQALTGDGRYQLMEINDKIVRLDTRSGRFELCRMENGDWKCLVAQDERQRLEDAVAALSKRIAVLEGAQRQTAASRAAIPPAAPVPVAQPSTTATSPLTVARPTIAEAAPAASLPAPTAPGWSPPPARGPTPALPVPTATIPGSLNQDAAPAAAPGTPFDISPGATVAAEPEKPGLVDRITGLLPGIGW